MNSYNVANDAEMNSYNPAEDADPRIWSQIWWVAEASKNSLICVYLGRVKSAVWFRAAKPLERNPFMPLLWFRHQMNEKPSWGHVASRYGVRRGFMVDTRKKTYWGC